jgi:hypothetical protein
MQQLIGTHSVTRDNRNTHKIEGINADTNSRPLGQITCTRTLNKEERKRVDNKLEDLQQVRN